MTARVKTVVGFCLVTLAVASGFFARHYLDQEHWTALVQVLLQTVASVWGGTP